MTDSTTRSASASIDPFHQKFDCLYDGDINACDKDCKQLGECKRRTPGKASPPSVAATGDEVWEVSSRTISCLFATEDAAKSFIATLPASVGGGMQVAKRFVLGAARSSSAPIQITRTYYGGADRGRLIFEDINAGKTYTLEELNAALASRSARGKP
jgi:hypothetical protein